MKLRDRLEQGQSALRERSLETSQVPEVYQEIKQNIHTLEDPKSGVPRGKYLFGALYCDAETAGHGGGGFYGSAARFMRLVR